MCPQSARLKKKYLQNLQLPEYANKNGVMLMTGAVVLSPGERVAVTDSLNRDLNKVSI